MTHLIDNSAFNRLAHPSVRERVVALMNEQALGTCGVIELEALYSARSPSEYEELWDRRGATLVYVETDDDAVQQALAIQRRLAAQSQVRGAKIPDLLIAGVAKRHDLTVLHYDSDFDRIGEIGEVRTEWIVPRGSIP